MSPPPNKDGKGGLLDSLVKGTLTGGIEACITYPTEYLKTQLQLQSKSKPEFTGLADCAKKTVQSQGFKGLYRGALPLVLGSSAKQAARWTTYNTVSEPFRDEKGKIGLLPNMFCGLVAGCGEALVAVTPIETLKSRVIDDYRKGTNRYTGSLDAAVKILKADGPGGLYRGVVPTMAKQGTNQMVRFPLQLLFVKSITGGDEVKMKDPLWNGIAGAMAGAGSVLLTMPQDTIKSRMQGEDAKQLYKGTMDCARQIIKTEGWMFFYSGTWPRLIRVSLDVGLTFFIYPLLNKLF